MLVVSSAGVSSRSASLYQFGQIEGWIPIFLFAMLFGLSMDYEVFCHAHARSLGRAARQRACGRPRARAHGRIVTAAAIIMVAAFSGFVAGRIAGLQEFGLGLAVAVFVDATVTAPCCAGDQWRWSGATTGGCRRTSRVYSYDRLAAASSGDTGTARLRRIAIGTS